MIYYSDANRTWQTEGVEFDVLTELWLVKRKIEVDKPHSEPCYYPKLLDETAAQRAQLWKKRVCPVKL